MPLVTQLTGLLGQVGQIASTIPLVALLKGVGWQWSYLGAGRDGRAVVDPGPPGRPGSTTRRGGATDARERRQALRDLRASFAQAGTRLGLWSHFATQFSGMVFALMWGFPFMTLGLGYSPTMAGWLLTMMVLAATVIGPVLGALTARYPMRRSNLIFGVLLWTIAIWTVVLLWPGAPPLPVIVVLVLGLAAYGPASAVGFDFARTFNPADPAGRRDRDRQHGWFHGLAGDDLRHRRHAGPVGPDRELRRDRLQDRLLLPVRGVGLRPVEPASDPTAGAAPTCGPRAR